MQRLFPWLATFLVAIFPLSADVPHLLHHQGRIAVDGTNFDGVGLFKFALVNEAGTTTYWSNDGTSTGGSEPTAAVNLPVTRGLYAVLLGDTSFPNMTALSPGAFENEAVYLRIWFDDGANGSERLDPDQRIAAVAYAMMADGVKDGAITTAKIANHAVGSMQLADGAVGGDQLADASVGMAKLADGAVGGSQLAEGAVTADKLNLGVSSGDIHDGVLSGLETGTATFSVTFPALLADVPQVSLTPPGWVLGSADENGFTATLPFAPINADPDASSGNYASATLVNGNPAIAYFDGTTLYFVRANDPEGTTWGARVALDSVPAGLYVSLAVVAGKPCVCYEDGVANDLKFVRATDADGTAWNAAQTVDADGNKGRGTSLREVNGRPAIAYLDDGQFDLLYVRANDAEGASWPAPTVLDSSGTTGQYPSLAVVDGNPAISYYKNTGSSLRYVRAADADGASWGPPIDVESAGTTGWFTSLAVIDGAPAISYYYASGPTQNIRFIRATDATGTTWGSSVDLATPGLSTNSISLTTVDGRPAVAYYDTGADLVQVVQALDASGATWGPPIAVASTTNNGSASPLLDINGRPAVAYRSGNLKFAVLPELDWSVSDGTVAPLIAMNVADGAIGSQQLADGAVAAGKIASNAVGSAQIAAGAVGSSQIAAGAVGGGQLAADAIDGSHIADGAVGSAQIAAGAVGMGQIAEGAVGSAQIGAQAVQAANIAGSGNDRLLVSNGTGGATWMTAHELLLSQGYTPSLPGIVENICLMEIDGIFADPVQIINGPGVQIEDLGGDPVASGLNTEFSIVFDYDGPAVSSLQSWFDTPSSRNGFLVVTDTTGAERYRWNFTDFELSNIEAGGGTNGKNRYTLSHTQVPDTALAISRSAAWLENIDKKPGDTEVEINGVIGGVWPAVELDTVAKTLTMTFDFNEGGGVWDWVANTATSGTAAGAAKSISLVYRQNNGTEIGRNNFFQCFPIHYQHYTGFDVTEKGRERVVISYDRGEDADSPGAPLYVPPVVEYFPGDQNTEVAYDLADNRVDLEIPGIFDTDPMNRPPPGEAAVVLSGPGYEIERIEGFDGLGRPSDQSGDNRAFPLVMEIGGTALTAIETWKGNFEQQLPLPSDSRAISLVVRDGTEAEVYRWNSFLMFPYEILPLGSGRSRVTFYSEKPPNMITAHRIELAGSGWGESLQNNPDTDLYIEIEGVSQLHAEVEEDEAERTLSIHFDYGEGSNIFAWARDVAEDGISAIGKKRLTISSSPAFDYFGCFPMLIQQISGWDVGLKGKAKVVLSYDRKETAP